MNVFRNALVVLLFTSTLAAAAPASEDSIKQLLVVAQSQKLVDSLLAQVDSLMSNAIQQALAGKTPTARQQQAIANMKNRMIGLMQRELAWERLEPAYLRLYKEVFTEEEIVEMLSFYKTTAGQAVIKKMPLLMQQVMLEMQKTMGEMNPQMQKIMQDFVSEMTAASK